MCISQRELFFSDISTQSITFLEKKTYLLRIWLQLMWCCVLFFILFLCFWHITRRDSLRQRVCKTIKHWHESEISPVKKMFFDLNHSLAIYISYKRDIKEEEAEMFTFLFKPRRVLCCLFLMGFGRNMAALIKGDHLSGGLWPILSKQ